jgi:serine/threonine protein phosphatase PrpC
MTLREPSSSETPSASVPAGSSRAAPGLQFDVYAQTDVGKVREHNEDNFLIADLTEGARIVPSVGRVLTLGPRGAVFAVCDGMGGAAAGEVASQLAVDILLERLLAAGCAGANARDDLARSLVSAVETAGIRIYHEARADRSRHGMGTTVTAAALLDDFLFFAQVGDSRAYLLREDKLVQVTRDQSLVNQLIEAGQLTEEEAETFEHNNIILQALGTADTVQVDLTFAALRRGDTLMLCSDGLSGMVRSEEIREVLKSGGTPAELCKALIDRANAAGGHDNVTVVVVRFDGASTRVASSADEPLKYRKYVLTSEADGEKTTPMQQMLIRSNPPPALPQSAPGSSPDAPSSGTPRSLPAPPDHDYDRVDIPGADIPLWGVIGIVAAVVLLLGVMAVVLLR